MMLVKPLAFPQNVKKSSGIGSCDTMFINFIILDSLEASDTAMYVYDALTNL